ncbi:hypothetical protein GCM10010844_00280 [Deinococcus radiotolerans]|uniref:Uncharacterized protein n=1 Tax=Deinococcus radiotolerans TaxID=1309407 RepID=A0ABQ2FCT8_9DEIO|nr:hypothetical protein GCM10010844_00280 [Deinococcus radiotolerans]
MSLRGNEAQNLRLLSEARPSQVTVFRSASGRSHLKFNVEVEGKTYAAIMYEGDWTAADQERLKAGSVNLVGLWDTYANQPSFTVKRLLSQAPALPSTSKPLLKIASAQVNVASIKKFTSRNQKVHVTYTFTVNNKTYQGVVYAGDWSSVTLDALRSGKATLFGTWGTFENKPNFITQRVER